MEGREWPAPQGCAAPERIGSLRETSLPKLVLGLHRDGFEGTLELRRQHVEKRFWFRGGDPVAAESNVVSESLGIQLLDAGRIDRAAYARVVEAVRSGAQKEGAALLTLRLVTPRELFEALREQVRHRLVECFAWPDGLFRVNRDGAPARGTEAFRIDPVATCFEGLVGHWGVERCLRELLAYRSLYALPGPRFEAICARLDPRGEQRALRAALAAHERMDGVLSRARGAAGVALVVVLEAAGALAFCAEPPRGADEETAPLLDGAEVEVVVAPEPGTERAEPPAAGGPPSPEPARPPRSTASDGGELAREIRALHERLSELDHYEILGVDRDARAADVKRAYLKRARRLHPDTLVRAGLPELRSEAEAVFARIAEAHRVLSDPESRTAYDAELDGGPTEADAERLVHAETLYRKAEILMRAGNFRGARELLEAAVALWPEEAAYRSALGWSLHKQRPPASAEARPHLEAAVALAPDDAVHHFRLGMVLRALGEEQASREALARARSLEPRTAGRR